jgi:hypothetical protein
VHTIELIDFFSATQRALAAVGIFENSNDFSAPSGGGRLPLAQSSSVA